MMVRTLIPVSVVIMAVFVFSIQLSANQLHTATQDQPVPAFQLPLLHSPEHRITDRDFLGQLWVVNVWASWCSGCRTEHALITRLSRDHHLTLVGINYQDHPADANRWLRLNGNPYDLVVSAKPAPHEFDWGLYGVPATYVIDHQGKVRYHHIGALSLNALERELLPLTRHYL